MITERLNPEDLARIPMSEPFEGTLEIPPMSPERRAEIDRAFANGQGDDLVFTNDEIVQVYKLQRYRDKRLIKGIWYRRIGNVAVACLHDHNE
jgi:hypothetical protein